MSSITARFLALSDVENLMELEQQQWSGEQIPSFQTSRDRITIYPNLCVGAFCQTTGRVLASLFLKPSYMCQYTDNIT